MNKKNNRTLRPLGAALLVIGVSAISPRAMANTWLGNIDANLATGTNWTAAPVSGDNWSFGAAGSAGTTLNNNLSAGFTVNGLAFANSASSYTMTGNAIALTNHISVGTGSQNQVVNFDINIGASRQANIQSGSVLTLGGVLSGGSFTLNGAGGANVGKLILTNSNTFTGNVSIAQGTLEVSSVGNQGSTTSNLGAGTTVTLGSAAVNAAILSYTGVGETTNRNITIGGNTTATLKSNGSGALIWSGTISNGSNTTARTITLSGANTNTNAVNSVIADNGAGTVAVTKAEVGIWALGGNNSYTGATTINAGTLLITGNSSGATGAVAVNAGGTLGGNGTIGGDVTVANSTTAVLAPGTPSDATDTLALNNKNLTFAGSNSQVRFDIAGTSAGSFDRVIGIGSLTEAGVITFTLAGAYTTASWDVLDFTSKTGGFNSITLTGSYVGTLSLTATDLWTGNVGGQDWSFNQSTGVLSVVPEPSSCVLVGVGLGFVIYRTSRRRVV